MPITKRAIKKLTHDRNRQTVRSKAYVQVQKAIRDVKRNPSKKTLSAAFQKLDKAAKRSLIHKNKASRLKARLSRLLTKKTKK